MKSRKELKHQNLITESVDQLKSRFTPKVSDVKKAIDTLLDKEYLERVEGQRDLYRCALNPYDLQFEQIADLNLLSTQLPRIGSFLHRRSFRSVVRRRSLATPSILYTVERASLSRLFSFSFVVSFPPFSLSLLVCNPEMLDTTQPHCDQGRL